MNKEDAAAYLNMSVRTLQRHVSRGEITVSYAKGKKGDEAVFDIAELDQFKENPPPKRNRAAVTGMTVTTPNAVMSDMTPQSVMTVTGDAAENGSIGARFLAALEAQTEAQIVGQRVLLNLKDCQMLTGLSRHHLREAIDAGKLKGQIIGRSWRVKRSDLDAYVSEL
jgi:excisionase family DNA binding protein